VHLPSHIRKKRNPQMNEKTGEAKKETGQRQPTKKSIFQFLCTQKTDVGWLKSGWEWMRWVAQMHRTMVELSPFLSSSSPSLSGHIALSLAQCFTHLWRFLTHKHSHTHTHTNTILAASHEGPRTKDDGVARRLLRRLQRHPRKIQQQVDEDVAVAVDVAVEVEKTRKNVT